MLYFTIERQSDKTITVQVYEQVRQRILKSEFKAGDKLPSSRELATNLGVSRNVVLEAYEQLIIEGYLEVIPQSGTYVAHGSGLTGVTEASTKPDVSESNAFQSTVSSKADVTDTHYIDFKSGNPAMDYFPRKAWGKLTKDICMEADNELFGYTASEGVPKLRDVLATYLSRMRGVKCHSDQIIITSGATQGLYLATKLLTDTHKDIIVEDPISENILPIFTTADVNVISVPVDESGLMTNRLPQEAHPSFIFVVPSHQFPLGGTLPIQRRIQLLDYARKKDAYIIEDDYNSEFTYGGIPVPSIQGLDPDHVIYVGTFSKILSPALRMGYIVLPWSLVEQFQKKRWFVDRHTSAIEQMVLASFIENGYFDRHVRKMKSIYKKRRKALVQSIKKQFDDQWSPRILGTNAGMHLVLELDGVYFSDELLEKIRSHGVIVYPVRTHAQMVHGAEQPSEHHNKLVLGYGSLTESMIDEGIAILKNVIEDDMR